VLMVLLSGRTFLLSGLLSGFNPAALNAMGWDMGRSIMGLASGVMGLALIVLRGGAAFRTPIALAIAAVALVMSALTVPLGPVLFILAGALMAHRLPLAGLAVGAIIWIIGSFYYWLGWPLTQKAALSIGMGLALGAVTLLTRPRKSPGKADVSSPAPMPALAASLLIGLSVAATGAIAGKTVAEKENIIRNGRQIFVALAPVDPRSLMQGDYMALRFALPNRSDLKATYAIGKVDARQIATITRMQTESGPLAADEILLALKRKNGVSILGTDAWFFKEGTGKIYEKARFGEFRIGPNGEMALTGMADEGLNILQ